MANSKQIKALIQSHSEGDNERFYSIAMQMAAHAAKNGHGRLAQELRDLVDAGKQKNVSSRVDGWQNRPVPVVQPRGELVGLLTASYPKTRLSSMALDNTIHRKLERVLLEQRQRSRIRDHGLSPQKKLLLVGPPGTGKTMTASVLAGELGLPYFTIQLDALITKFMGETAAKLRLIFDAMSQTRGVYLFDEFDSLGGERSAGNDVGEIRRVLNSFLQFLELDDSDSLVVCSTNHHQLLDKALFRRFDTVIEYSLPSHEICEKVMRAKLSALDTRKIDWKEVTGAAEGLSHAEIARACEHAAKNAILQDSTQVESASLIEALKERRLNQNAN